MSDAQRVIDDIDALVEEQLAGGEPETGYDFDDPDFPECRCGLDWHGLPAYGCPGSDTEGPLRSAGMTFDWWPEVPSRESGSVFADQLQQWQRTAAAYAELMHQQFAECWSRMVETLASRSILLESERFNLHQWVAGHDWQAETREESEPECLRLPAPATQPPMWAVDVTRSRRGRQ